MKFLLTAFFIFANQALWAQEGLEGLSRAQHPAVRPKPPQDPNKESSSFMGDPENLDPLRSRQENLKDDAEPVLEDIRQVLDAPTPPPPEIKPQEDFKPSALPKKLAKKEKKKVVAKKKKLKPIKIVKKPRSTPILRNDDDPDEAVERGFYKNYMQYNSEPTSVDMWSAATLGRSSEVYIVQKGDTLWTISETLFGDSLFWPKIWAINRQGILNPHFITPGMKVFFYPGSSENVPTLAVGRSSEQQTEIQPGQAGPQENLTEEFATGSNNMEMQMSDGTMRPPIQGNQEIILPQQLADAGIAMAEGVATPLPPSLPLYRSDLYFGERKRIDMIDLDPPERLQIVQYVDIFLTDRLVLTDFKVSQQGNVFLNCRPGETISGVTFIRKTPTDEYTILEPLDPVKIGKKTVLYPYRRVGSIAHYNEDTLKIKECNFRLSDAQVFVPTAVLNSLKTQKQSEETPRVIGGPEVRDKENHFVGDFIYLDMGKLSFEIGQKFNIQSLKFDEQGAQVKILDRFGSYAVGIITQETQPIVTGDKVQPQ